MMAISDTDMMDNFVEHGINLDEFNLNWYLGEDRASFVWTGTIRTGNRLCHILFSHNFLRTVFIA